jgi:hypothetical protein
MWYEDMEFPRIASTSCEAGIEVIMWSLKRKAQNEAGRMEVISWEQWIYPPVKSVLSHLHESIDLTWLYKTPAMVPNINISVIFSLCAYSGAYWPMFLQMCLSLEKNGFPVE